MSKMPSHIYERIDSLVKRRGEKGLAFLLIFKSIKKDVLEQLEQEHPKINWDEYTEEINRECISLSKEIINESRENPREEEINEIVKKLASDNSITSYRPKYRYQR